MTKRATGEEWAKRVAAWRASGLTAKQFAAEIGARASTLRWWVWHLGAGGKKAEPRGRRGFVEVVAPWSGARAASEAFELELRSGDRLRIPSSFDGEALRRLLGIVEGR